MDWVISGIWGDENMPPIELLESELFGTRVSPIIDTVSYTHLDVYKRQAKSGSNKSKRGS